MNNQENYAKLKEWVQNHWPLEDQHEFEIFDVYVQNNIIDRVPEDLKNRVRALVEKHYDKYISDYVDRKLELEDSIERSRHFAGANIEHQTTVDANGNQIERTVEVAQLSEIEKLEEKIKDKNNYLRPANGTRAFDNNLEYKIEQDKKKLEKYVTDITNYIKSLCTDLGLDYDFSKLENLDFTNPDFVSIIENEFSTIEQKLRDRVAVMDNSEPEFQEAMQKYLDFMRRKSFDAYKAEIADRYDKLNRRIALKERKDKNFVNMQYDVNQYRLDQERLRKLKAGIEAAQNWIRNNGNDDYLLMFDSLFTNEKKQTPEPQPEPKPIPQPEPKKEETGKYLTLRGILSRIDPENEKYNGFDNFVYNHKDIKIFNWHHTNARTFIDHPMKYTKAVIGAVINTPMKGLSKLAAKTSERRDKFADIDSRISQLSEEELEFLLKNLSPNTLTQNFGSVPRVVLSAIHKRLGSYIMTRTQTTNAALATIYNNIILEYKKAKAIKVQLSDPQLPNEERQRLTNEFNTLSASLRDKVISYERKYAEADGKLNAEGYHALGEHIGTYKNELVGGTNASNKYHRKEAGLLNYLGAKKEQAKDGFELAELFLFEQKMILEKTEVKRTLKNRGGYAAVGATQFTPLIHQHDYHENDFMSDVLRTVAVVANIMTMVKMSEMQEQIAAHNQTIAQQNLIIESQNQQITQLKSIMDKYITNPEEALQEYANFAKQQVGYLQSATEYTGMLAQAGTATNHLESVGDVYKSVDGAAHEFSAAAQQEIDRIAADATLSVAEKNIAIGKVVTEANQELTRTIISLKPGLTAHIDKFGSMYDYTGVSGLITAAQTSDPTFVAGAFEDLCKVAEVTNNMQALSYISELSVSVPMAEAITGLTALMTETELQQFKKLNEERKYNTLEEDAQEKTNDLIEALDSVDIDAPAIAKENYNKALEQWNEHSAFYKFIHRKQKPKEIDYQIEAAEVEYGQGGMSL